MTIFLRPWAVGTGPSAVPQTGQNLASSGACSPQLGHARTGLSLRPAAQSVCLSIATDRNASPGRAADLCPRPVSAAGPLPANCALSLTTSPGSVGRCAGGTGPPLDSHAGRCSSVVHGLRGGIRLAGNGAWWDRGPAERLGSLEPGSLFSRLAAGWHPRPRRDRLGLQGHGRRTRAHRRTEDHRARAHAEPRTPRDPLQVGGASGGVT